MNTNIEIVLVRTRFPENIGMVARACANFGFSQICLVEPERKDLLNAIPLATPKGLPLLRSIRQVVSLAEAVEESNLIVGTTARTGGWRKNMLPMEDACKKICDSNYSKVSLVFGPEDRGLQNSEISLCDYLVHIHTTQEAPSLNLAQAVLIMLYECSRYSGSYAHKPNTNSTEKAGENYITGREKSILINKFKKMLLDIDCIHGDNPDYFMLQWHNIFTKANLKRHEYDAIMGLCRQINNRFGKVEFKH